MRLLNGKTILSIVLILAAGALMVLAAEEKKKQGEVEMKQPQNYFVRLLGTRPGWPENMTEREQKIMEEHFLYLKQLTAARKVLMAGPCLTNPPFGLIVLQVDSEAEAREIMSKEPSVVAGIHTYDMAPLVVSLMAVNPAPKPDKK